MRHKGSDLPIIAYYPLPQAHPGQCDCDCACSLALPAVLEAQAISAFFDCDCACAGPTAAGRAHRPGHHEYARPTDLQSFPLQEGWQVYFNPWGPVGIGVLNPAAQQVLALFDHPRAPGQGMVQTAGMADDVLARAVGTMLQIGLLRPVGAAVMSAAPCSTLSAWLHVTEACNLNCPYCYVYKRPTTMSAEVGRATVERLVEMALNHGYDTLKLKYAGGEPTLHPATIEMIHTQAARRTAQTGLTLEEVILSNGVGVTDGVLDFIARAGMKLMVSLDGGAESHDRLRARPDGRSTYPAVVDTVERALARGLRPNISITLTALNLDGIEQAVAFALERELPFHLNFYRECASTGPAGRPDDGGSPSPLAPQPAELLAAMLRVLDLIQSHPAYPLPLSGILDRTRLDLPHRHPCSAGRDYLVVDTHGRISACQMLLEQPWSALSAPDPLATIQQQGRDIFRPVEEYPDCRLCQWRTACSGGCPLLRQSALHDRYCQVYRALLPELVRLEGNRLLACHA